MRRRSHFFAVHWNGPHLLNEAHNPVVIETGCVLAEPESSPHQEMMGQLLQQHDHLLSGQQAFADHRQPHALLSALSIGLHASPPVIVLDHACHCEIGATSEDDRLRVASLLILGGGADGVL